jgi:DnaD/phage-associated family protein
VQGKEQPDIEQPEEPKKVFTATRPQKPDFVFTAQRLAVDEELKMLVEETQTTLGKVLSNSDISTLLMLKDTCGLPLDVIFMLIHYCVSIDKGNIRTIENIGVQWANDGIYSLEAAENKIEQIQKTTANFSLVSKAFGLKNVGSPTKKQLEYGNKWVTEWKFSPEMLREAYERCVDTKGTMNFRYIDGILKRWHASHVHTIDELNKYEKSANKPVERRESSFDIEELDRFHPLDDI